MGGVIKYFILQVFASTLFFLSLLLSQFYYDYRLSSIVIFFIIILKLGMRPVHFWLIQVVESLEWQRFIILMTWQKLIPLYILRLIKFNLINLFVIISLLFRVFRIIGQISIRKLLVFSSINHLS